MPDLKLVDLGRQANFVDLNAQLIGYADRVEELQSPDQVLNELHAVTTRGICSDRKIGLSSQKCS